MRDGQVVVLDGGTTTLELARALRDDLRASVITPLPHLAGCFFCLMPEGGASDWSAKHVRDGLAGAAALGATAYAGFSVGMGGPSARRSPLGALGLGRPG